MLINRYLRSRKPLLIVAVFLCALTAQTSFAAEEFDLVESSGLSIYPTRVELSKQRRTASFTVKNKGKSAAVVSARALAWTQADDQDVHSKTRDLIVNPPVTRLEPGEEQLFRLGLRRSPDRSVELAYRVHVRETPSERQDISGPQIAVAFLLPVFVQPMSNRAQADVSWTVAPAKNGEDWVVNGVNRGNRHLRLRGMILQQDQVPLAVNNGVQYLLPGKKRSYFAKSLEGITGDAFPDSAILLFDTKRKQTVELGR